MGRTPSVEVEVATYLLREKRVNIRANVARTVAPLLSVGLLLAACGSSPTDTPSAEGKAGDCSNGNSLKEVYAATDGQTGEEYTATLAKLAKDEQQPFGFYHSGTFTKEIEAFQKEYDGLKVGDFEATSERVMERARSEQKAGRVGSAVVLGADDDMDALTREGGLDDLQVPSLDFVGDAQKGDTWVSPIGIMTMPSYNSKSLPKEDLPKSWEDFFTNFKGKAGIEITDWEWYGGMVTRYLMGQKGMSEEDAIAMVTKGLHNAQTVDGHTLVASLLASNQYNYVPGAFAHYIPDLQADGAPVQYQDLPADMPPFYLQLGVGVSKGTCQAASGLLFIDFLMSKEGQDIIASRNYIAPSSTYDGETLLDKYPNYLEAAPLLKDGQTQEQANQEWAQKYDELLRTIGGKPLSD
jgi:ABC-type Fe3+ transport system substrate-binding protein